MTSHRLSTMQYNVAMISPRNINIFSGKLSALLLLGAGLLLPLPSLADTATAANATIPVASATMTSVPAVTPAVTMTTAAPAAVVPLAVAAPTTVTATVTTAPTAISAQSDPSLANIQHTDDSVPSPAPLADLWDRIRLGFGMNASDSPLIETQINWYAQRPDYVSRMVERSRRYLFHILGEVEKRGMPTEIALLPMIESAYNPMAYSASHASGIWQFIPATGRNFGLKQTGWYDGRRDIIAATDAALDYLTKLHNQFGTWELALAAYNCGEGCVAHAIARNQALGLPTDYSDLNLPSETRHYVPKLLAIKQIIADPISVGLSLDSIPNQAYFTTVALNKSMDVSLAAKLANMPVDDFISLNPAYSKPVMRSGASTQLLLPVDKVNTFSTNLQNYNRPLVTWQMYTAKLGERVKTIAKKFHVTVAWLIAHNPIHLSHKGKLTSNHTLIVPLRGKIVSANPSIDRANNPGKIAYAENTAIDTPAKDILVSADLSVRNQSAHHAELIKVKSGDTLYGIAKRNQVSIQDLEKWNNIGHQHLKPGQTLHIAAPDLQHAASKRQSRHKKSSKTASARQKKPAKHKKYASKERDIKT